jgi:hypothetical protein
MAVPAIYIKVKGAKALSALCANGQLPACLQLKGAALAGPGAAGTLKLGPLAAFKSVEIEGARAALTKGAMLPAAELEFGGAKVVATKSLVASAGPGKAAATAAKGTLLGSYGCYGLGPWGLGFLLTTLGLAALAYYFYRQNRQLLSEFAGEVAPD